MWKRVSNRTLGIISKICKLRGGTPALLRPVGTPQDFAWLDLGKNDSSSVKCDASYVLSKEVDWPGDE